MATNYQKEIMPVLYDSSGLKILYFNNWPSNILLSNMHWHERIELILVTSGSLHFRLPGFETILTKDQLAIIPSKVPHYAMTGEDYCSCRTLMFDITAFYNQLPVTERLLKPLVEQNLTFMPWTDQPEIIAVMKSIIDKSDEDTLSPLFRIGKIYELIALLYRHCRVKEVPEATPQNQFQEVLEFINTHFEQDISSVTLCSQFGYSEGYFCRQFKAVTGFSPMIYIRILRLEKAREMMKNKQLSFSEIAVRCGFCNANYFTRCFKSHYHMTPSEYRRQQ